MRVALITVHTSPGEQPATANAGGLNVLVLELSRELARLGHDVTLVAPRITDAQLAFSPPPGVTLHEVDVPQGLLPAAERDSRTLAFSEALSELLPNLDVVHSHYWLAAVAVENALERYPKTLASRPTHVVSLHTLGAEKQRLGSFEGEQDRIVAERRLLRQVAIIAHSSAEARTIEEFAGLNRDSVKVVTPGVDLTTFSPRKEPHLGHPTRLSVVGRIQPFKGQDFALAVFAQFCQLVESTSSELPELIVVGSPTPDSHDYGALLRESAEEMGLTHQVHFVGAKSREETAEILRGSFFAIIPSVSETFGLVARESAACGTPVIAQDVGGLAESVRSGVSGILMPNRNPHAWAAQLHELWGDPDTYEHLRESAAAFASSFSWRHTAQHVSRVYEQLRNERQ